MARMIGKVGVHSPTTTGVTTLITSEMVVTPSPVVDDPRYDPVTTLIRRAKISRRRVWGRSLGSRALKERRYVLWTHSTRPCAVLCG
eukprot:4999015-Prymnesium_polylepis.1